MRGCAAVIDDRRNSLPVAARTEQTSSADVTMDRAENAALDTSTVAPRDWAARVKTPMDAPYSLR